MTAERLEVRRQMAAPASRVFDLLCEPSGHVAIDASGMLQFAEGTRVAGVGDEFVVHMDLRAFKDVATGQYDVTVSITDFKRDALIEWTVRGVRPTPEHRYGYRLEPNGDGTLVTSYYDWSRIPDDHPDKATYPCIPESALRATLGILARTVER